jgi:hypothetical protein
MSIKAMKHYEAALLEAFPRGATGDVFHHWNEARKAQREWVGLTEQEAAECWSTSSFRTWQAIEAKLKEKNT